MQQINQLEMASGLDIDVGRIEGSVFGELTLHDLTLKDPKGTFFVAPEATLDWRPLAYFRNHIDIKRLEIPRARLFRLPELKPGDPNAPLLPDIDVDVGQIKVDRMLVDPAVTGYRHLLSLAGSARIDDGRAQVALDTNAIAGPGLPGGDKLALRIDAVPEANRLAMGVRVEAPANGFVAKLTGLQPAARRHDRRQRHLGELARPGQGDPRRQGVRRPRRRRQGRHLHRRRADEPGHADGGGSPPGTCCRPRSRSI